MRTRLSFSILDSILDPQLHLCLSGSCVFRTYFHRFLSPTLPHQSYADRLRLNLHVFIPFLRLDADGQLTVWPAAFGIALFPGRSIHPLRVSYTPPPLRTKVLCCVFLFVPHPLFPPGLTPALTMLLHLFSIRAYVGSNPHNLDFPNLPDILKQTFRICRNLNPFVTLCGALASKIFEYFCSHVRYSACNRRPDSVYFWKPILLCLFTTSRHRCYSLDPFRPSPNSGVGRCLPFAPHSLVINLATRLDMPSSPSTR